MPAETFRLSLENTRKWHALAERRRAYFVDLYRSGRWKRYYGEEVFLEHLRNVMKDVERWAKVLERWSPAPVDRQKTAA
jgi:uncharacterized repeat protein (TIGR03809 family)